MKEQKFEMRKLTEQQVEKLSPEEMLNLIEFHSLREAVQKQLSRLTGEQLKQVQRFIRFLRFENENTL